MSAGCLCAAIPSKHLPARHPLNLLAASIAFERLGTVPVAGVGRFVGDLAAITYLPLRDSHAWRGLLRLSVTTRALCASDSTPFIPLVQLLILQLCSVAKAGMPCMSTAIPLAPAMPIGSVKHR